MRALSSQLSGDGSNADRVLITDDAVLVLDGASAFEPVPVDPGEYAGFLGRAIASRLNSNAEVQIADAVADAISATAGYFDLKPGWSPSSTVAILRTRGNAADLFVLGDSPIYYGTTTRTSSLRDDRLAAIGQPQRAAYIHALKSGCGYDSAHRDNLAALQRAQREHRNQPGGYWIAEADPIAAFHAISTTVDPSSAEWAVTGTDGATDLLAATDPGRWPQIAAYSQPQLDALLALIYEWEELADPTGQIFPRAKRHDDKTLAAISAIFTRNSTETPAQCCDWVRPLSNLPT